MTHLIRLVEYQAAVDGVVWGLIAGHTTAGETLYVLTENNGRWGRYDWKFSRQTG